MNQQTTRCPHGYAAPVVCPECDPDVYARARPQAEQTARRITAERETTALDVWCGLLNGKPALSTIRDTREAAEAAVDAIHGMFGRPGTSASDHGWKVVHIRMEISDAQ